MFDSLLAEGLIPALLAQEPTRPSWWNMLPWVAVLGVMLVIMILPGRKQAKKRKQMLAGMNKNDRVMTRGGIIGVVMDVREHEVILKIDESNNTRVHFSRQAIQHVFADKDDINPSQAEA